MQKVCVFIDGSSFYFGLKTKGYPTRVDYHKLSRALVGPDRELVRTYYYNSAYDPFLSPENWKSQQPFFDSLERTPYVELRLGRLIPNKEGSGFREKGTDVRMGADMVYCAARKFCDTLVVVTSDTDFAPALENVKALGVFAELAFFSEFQPKELVRATDTVINLSEALDHYREGIFPDVPDNIGNRVESSTARSTVRR